MPSPVRPLSDEYIQAALAAPHGEERAAVIREAWSWINTPWSHENRSKGRGVDCGNLIAGIFAGAGLIKEPPLYKYAHDFYLHSADETFRDIVEQFCRKVDEPVLPGDVAGFKFGMPSVAHTAIVICWPLIVHAVRPRQKRVVGEEIETFSPLGRTPRGIWRLKRWCE